MVLVNLTPRARHGELVWLGGVPVTFVSGRSPQGDRILVSEVGPEDAPLVKAAIARHPHYQIVDYGMEPWSATKLATSAASVAVRAAVAPTVDVALEVRRIAMSLRWDAEDLAGVGLQGDPSADGGRSPVTGLTLGEMALAAPPSDWAAAREETYPWEHPDWSPPLPGWVPPSHSSKRAVPGWVPSTAVIALVSERIGERAVALEAVLAGMSSRAAERSPLSLDAVIDAVIAELAPAPADDEDEDEDEDADADEDEGADADEDADADPAVLAGYPAENVPTARAIAHELLAKRGGPYHPNAVNFLLKNAGLATVGAAQLDALLAVQP